MDGIYKRTYMYNVFNNLIIYNSLQFYVSLGAAKPNRIAVFRCYYNEIIKKISCLNSGAIYYNFYRLWNTNDKNYIA